MIDLDYTIIVQFINFIITLVVLNFILIKPVRGIIKKRADTMSNLLDGAEEFNAKAEEKLAGYAKALDEARAKGTAARNAVKEAGLEKEKEIISAATGDAQAKLGEERKVIGQEADTATAALKGQVDAMAAKVAGRILA